jgi:hypothetical protein
MMNDPRQAIMPSITLETQLFPPTSRYHGLETTTMETREGKTIVYLRRRFVPPPERFALLKEHTVTEGDRLDNMAAHYLGDPEQFWRIADANGVMWPDELTAEPGKTCRITLPEGIPGVQND